MSVKIYVDSFNKEIGTWLKNELSISPVLKERWESGRKIVPKPPPPFSFFKVDGPICYIPFATARLAKLGPFSENETVRKRHEFELRKIPSDRSIFTANLLPRQTKIQNLKTQIDSNLIKASPIEMISNQLKSSNLEIGPNGENSGSCIFGMYPGFGKTVVTAYSIVEKKYPTLIIVYRDALIKQWGDTIKNYTKMNVFVWTSQTKKKIKWNEINFDNIDVIVSMDTCADQLPSELLKRIGILVLDEAHTLCTEKRSNLFFLTQPKYVIACTATLERPDMMHRIIYRAVGNFGVFISSPVHFELYKVSTPFVPQMISTKIDWSAICQSLAASKERNEFASNLICKLVEDGNKVLVMTSLVEHAETLASILADKKLFPVSTIFGKISSYTDAKVLVASMSKAGTGFDEVFACQDWQGVRLNSLVLMTSVASFAPMVQIFGRVFRALDPKIYYFVDKMEFIERKHWKEAKKYADEKIEDDDGILRPRGTIILHKND